MKIRIDSRDRTTKIELNQYERRCVGVAHTILDRAARLSDGEARVVLWEAAVCLDALLSEQAKT